MQPGHPELLRRHEGNPILTPDDWPYPVNAVFNPGVTIGPDGETVLLVRVEDRTGVSHLTVARSWDGLSDWKIDSQPTFLPDRSTHDEAWGIEDPRITRTDEGYLVAYTGFSTGGPLVCLAMTEDLRHFERLGVVMSPEDKDAAVFPHRFGDRWALVHRPDTSGKHRVAAHIWISWSPDLRHWGEHHVLIHAREGAFWDAGKVGLGPPPLRTDAGWLIMYHGVKHTAAGAIYRVGTALLDLEDPGRVLVRSDPWVFGPAEAYERTGDVPDVVFPTGWVLDDDGDTLRIYYGAADTCVAVAWASLSELVEHLLGHCVCGRAHCAGEACPAAAVGIPDWQAAATRHRSLRP